MLDAPSRTVVVWDPLVRIFHWTLVTAVLTDLVLEAGSKIHVWAGYAVAGLVSFRLVWGIMGSRHARFTDFLRSPGVVLGYLRDLRRGDARHYLGHNPAGGAMILLLLIALVLTAGTGVLMNTDRFWGNSLLEGIHETAANAFYILVPVHLAGVVISSLLHKENLVRAMVTGRKSL
ncbi:MAG: cytochrome b/b6 domain-containing protein [Rhodospirillum sp.]|nr:cytochrome b/b6 domain-containing protein [Rhodospirillum sp.]MCF8488018.1 cytochrome b/b6 domain-containing protein [Rhodospirillum sp.]MCF8500285.1 cytochrome b/b6 domain-containing protein [Rhodospirillum sp.]